MTLSNFQIIQMEVVCARENDSLDYNGSNGVGKNGLNSGSNFKVEPIGQLMD